MAQGSLEQAEKEATGEQGSSACRVYCVVWQHFKTGQAAPLDVALLASYGSWHRAAWSRQRRKQRVSRGPAHAVCTVWCGSTLRPGRQHP
jgi:hypothetical protein